MHGKVKDLLSPLAKPNRKNCAKLKSDEADFSCKKKKKISSYFTVTPTSLLHNSGSQSHLKGIIEKCTYLNKG